MGCPTGILTGSMFNRGTEVECGRRGSTRHAICESVAGLLVEDRQLNAGLGR